MDNPENNTDPILCSKCVLVTGGAGYIGSHVCKALHKAGFTPITYDNLSTGHSWAVKWGPLIQGDLFDSDLLHQTFQKFKPIAVIHLAALINARESDLYPDLYHKTNVTATLQLLDAMAKNHVTNLIFASSAAVYGNLKKIPIEENEIRSPTNVYGKTKSLVEEVLEKSDFHYVILRYFNAAGADPDGEIGEAHTPETHLIPLAIRALDPAYPLKVFGNGIRDFIHVSDIAEAHVKALHWLLSKGSRLILNIGSGKGHSVDEVIAVIENQTKLKVVKEIHESNGSDPSVLIADISKAEKTIGWKPEFSDIEMMIKTALKWDVYWD